MEKQTILNEYAKIFEVYNKEMMKDMYMRKQDELVNVQSHQPTNRNSENAKIKKKYCRNKNTNNVYENTTNMHNTIHEHNGNDSIRNAKSNLRGYKETLKSRNDNKTNKNIPTVYTTLDTHKEKNVVEKEKNLNKQNIKECNKDSSNDDNHINVCKACYLQRVQDEIEGLKHTKKRTTTYPREFNHFLKYENISEAIEGKKEKIMIYKQMKEPQKYNENNETYNNEIMKELSEHISLKKDMFKFLNNVIRRN